MYDPSKKPAEEANNHTQRRRTVCNRTSVINFPIPYYYKHICTLYFVSETHQLKCTLTN